MVYTLVCYLLPAWRARLTPWLRQCTVVKCLFIFTRVIIGKIKRRRIGTNSESLLLFAVCINGRLATLTDNQQTRRFSRCVIFGIMKSSGKSTPDSSCNEYVHSTMTIAYSSGLTFQYMQCIHVWTVIECVYSNPYTHLICAQCVSSYQQYKSIHGKLTVTQ